MRRAWWHICGRFFEVRAERALKKYHQLKEKAGKYFSRLD